MKKKLTLNIVIITGLILSLMSLIDISRATTTTVQEQEPRYQYTTRPSEQLFIKKSPSVSKLVSNVTAGVTQGVDSNPLLDSSHRADSYTQEMADMHFKYPVFGSFLGFTNSKFGFNVTNINYYKVTDVNFLDGVADVGIEQEIFDKFLLNVGYVFDMMWFPNAENGTFAGNEINASIKQNITKWLYQKGTYRLLFKNYLEDKVLLGNKTRSSDLRADLRNTFEHELGIYIGSNTKIKIINQFYLNESNYQYADFYDYFNYKVGGSIIQFFTKKLYNISGFYYQRRNYDSRSAVYRQSPEKDNLYIVTTSFLYDVTKNLSVFINYSHSENHSNEPLERFVDSLYSAGLYYSF